MAPSIQEPYKTILGRMREVLTREQWVEWSQRNAYRRLTYNEAKRWTPEQIDALVEGLAVAIHTLPLKTVLKVDGLRVGLLLPLLKVEAVNPNVEAAQLAFHAVKMLEWLPVNYRDARLNSRDFMYSVEANAYADSLRYVEDCAYALDWFDGHKTYIVENAYPLVRDVVDRWVKDLPISGKVIW